MSDRRGRGGPESAGQRRGLMPWLRAITGGVPLSMWLLSIAAIVAVALGFARREALLDWNGDRSAVQEGAEHAGIEDIPWPDIEGLGPEDREQLLGQREVIESASGQSDELLGFEYGILGQMFFAYDLLEPAEVAFSIAESLDDANSRWPYFLGVLDQRAGNPTEAIAHFEQARELDPDDVPIMLRLSEALRAVGEVERAERWLELVLEQDPDSATANFLMGLLLLDRGNAAAAARRFELVLELQPGARTVYNPLAQAYRAMGEMQRSEDALARRGEGTVRLADPLMQEVVGMRRQAVAMLSQGSSLAQQGRVEDALEIFERAVETNPDSAAANLSLASALTDLGREGEALSYYRDAIALDPSNRQSRIGLAVALAETGELDGALDQLDRALEAEAGDPVANRLKGILLRRAGRCEQALPFLEQALAADDRDLTSILNLAVCSWVAGEPRQGLEAIESGLIRMPENRALQAAHVRLLTAADPEQRDGARAIAVAESLLDADRNVDALEVMAMALAADQRHSEAVELQQEAIDEARTRSDRADALDWMLENLERYRNGLPAEGPWPPSAYSADD